MIVSCDASLRKLEWLKGLLDRDFLSFHKACCFLVLATVFFLPCLSFVLSICRHLIGLLATR